jgi:universal stress protein A
MAQINIICPIDFTKLGDVALRYAAQLALQRRAKLVVVHVVPPNPEQDAASESLCESALTHLERFVPAEPNVRCEWVVLQGNVADQIIELAETLEMPQIVMSTRGRKGYHRVDMGPTAEEVLRRAPCPVVIVNDEDINETRTNNCRQSLDVSS